MAVGRRAHSPAVEGSPFGSRVAAGSSDSLRRASGSGGSVPLPNAGAAPGSGSSKISNSRPRNMAHYRSCVNGRFWTSEESSASARTLRLSVLARPVRLRHRQWSPSPTRTGLLRFCLAGRPAGPGKAALQRAPSSALVFHRSSTGESADPRPAERLLAGRAQASHVSRHWLPLVGLACDWVAAAPSSLQKAGAWRPSYHRSRESGRDRAGSECRLLGERARGGDRRRCAARIGRGLADDA
jgi:hypothetical protein